MIVQDSLTLAVTGGLIAELAAAGAGVWDETGIYKEGDWGIVFGRLPHSPATMIGVLPYMHNPDVEPGTDQMAVQVRIRSDSPSPVSVITVLDKVFDTLHGIEHKQWGGYHVPVVWRHFFADLGPDQNGRYEVTDNYYMYVDRI